jgi:hypothetical protein
MSKPSLVILIVEDECHRRLIYRYLKNLGFAKHEIRVVSAPPAKGSAYNWVRQQFVTEVSAYRSRAAKTALIVVIDADNGSVEARWRQLDNELRSGGKKSIDTVNERVARLVPKRNVETWILFLNGRTVDEETDYKSRHDFEVLIPQAAKALSEYAQSGSNPPEHWIDSLRRGLAELKRLNSR